MTEREILQEQREIEKLYKEAIKICTELKQRIYGLFREIGVPLHLKKKLRSQADYTLFNVKEDDSMFRDVMKNIFEYLKE
jgi:hypothetical protein